MAIQRLTAAYRSRSRPSSTLGAKASTVCPYYLDGDLIFKKIGDTRFIGYCAVFKVRGEARSGLERGLSKLNSMWAAPPAEAGRAACQVRSTFLVRSARRPEGRPPIGRTLCRCSLERR